MKTFDVIIPCYNNLPSLLNCLDGFENQTFKDFRVFVCINGDYAQILESLNQKSYSFEFKSLYFTDKQNHGRAANRNQALPFLESKYTLYHDSDLIPNNTLLENHIKILKNEDVISVGMVEYTNKTTNLWAKYQYYSGRAKYIHGAEIPVHYLNTQNAAIPTSILKQVGGQDETLKHYGGDDTELGYRISKVFSVKAIFNKKAYSEGFMDKSLSKALSDVEEFGKYNFKQIIQKHSDFNEIYKIGTYKKSALFRFFIHLPIDTVLRFLLFTKSIKLLHLITVKTVYKGYRS